jgi:hypothetical protein
MRPATEGERVDAANSAQRKYGIGTRLLSYLAASWCGCVLFALELFWIVVFVYCIATAYRTHAFLGFSGALILLCLGAVCQFVFGVAFGRFLVRAMPPQPLDSTKGRHPIIIAFFVCGLLAGIFSLAWLLNLEIGINSWAESEYDKEEAGKIVAILFVIIWVIGAVGPLILRHIKPSAFLHCPFVLFLRRFSTFSDRTLAALILKEAKDGVPVVFLTPARSRPKDWNPFLVGFAGLKLRHPLRSVPIVLRARDDDWQRVADELIIRAQTILVDASGGGAALHAEAEMVEKGQRWSNTVHLRNTAPTSGTDREPVGAFDNARCIEYSKSWISGLPRLAVSVVILLLIAWLATYVILPFGESDWPIDIPFSLWVAHGLISFILALIFCSIVWNPAINRDAKLELRKALRAQNQSGNKRPASIAVSA